MQKWLLLKIYNFEILFKTKAQNFSLTVMVGTNSVILNNLPGSHNFQLNVLEYATGDRICLEISSETKLYRIVCVFSSIVLLSSIIEITKLFRH